MAYKAKAQEEPESRTSSIMVSRVTASLTDKGSPGRNLLGKKQSNLRSAKLKTRDVTLQLHVMYTGDLQGDPGKSSWKVKN